MKANVPYKIYVHEISAMELDVKIPYSVEYVRTDAFIEKALKFIKTNVDRIVNNQHGVCMGCMDVEFRNYMEE